MDVAFWFGVGRLYCIYFLLCGASAFAAFDIVYIHCAAVECALENLALLHLHVEIVRRCICPPLHLFIDHTNCTRSSQKSTVSCMAPALHTVRAHPTPGVTQRPANHLLGYHQSEVIEPHTIDKIVRFLGGVIYRPIQ